MGTGRNQLGSKTEEWEQELSAVRCDSRITGNHKGCPYGRIRKFAIREGTTVWLIAPIFR